MIKALLIVFATCTSPQVCTHSEVAAAVFEYPRLVDCVRAKAAQREAGFEAFCLGAPFDPRKANLG